MLSLKLDTDAFERRLIAVLGPIPDTSIKFKKSAPVVSGVEPIVL